MSTAFNPSQDLARVVDGLQAITLRRPGTPTSQSIAHALRRVIAEREASASQGRYTRGDVLWHLPSSELTMTLQLGDQIVSSAGERVTILEFRRATLNSRVVCVCRNLVLAAGLESWIALQAGTPIVGMNGSRQLAWRDVVVGLPARVQLVREEAAVRDERRVVLQEFRITIGETVTLSERMRAVDPDGRAYDVSGLEAADRIDQLPTLLAQRTRPT